ncbi:hypothetical protein S40293_07284 [Stachybotrys chartarum IBT 40293]|nr:hypothetical protein S40293_07284 [Stachybotrys chartarum IBT 40293]KFA73509.1 hypothetical protein S40288_05795 [Stachybotrys chartarum IBT 40288]
MSDLKYFNYEGFGEHARENYGYNQAVRIGDRIEISGQGTSAFATPKGSLTRIGGWDPETMPPQFSDDLKTQIDQVFINIDLALKAAGGKGISQVYRINSYVPNMAPESNRYIKENLNKWFPDHRPIWTAVGVEKLAFKEMLIEIEAVAHDPVKPEI